jgi:hypothetical protein
MGYLGIDVISAVNARKRTVRASHAVCSQPSPDCRTRGKHPPSSAPAMSWQSGMTDTQTDTSMKREASPHDIRTQAYVVHAGTGMVDDDW